VKQSKLNRVTSPPFPHHFPTTTTTTTTTPTESLARSPTSEPRGYTKTVAMHTAQRRNLTRHDSSLVAGHVILWREKQNSQACRTAQSLAT
jgi:hypothetical protein